MAVRPAPDTPDTRQRLHFPSDIGLGWLAFSAAARCGDALFFADRETAEIVALGREGAGWVAEKRYALSKFFSLPGGSATGLDIEGLAVSDGWLWLVGSHALRRREPETEDSPKRALRRVGEIERHANRFILGRLPLAEDGALVPPGREGDGRRPGQLEAGKRSSTLMRWLAEDPLLAPFLSLPARENGLHIQGIAARGSDIWLGLRGPVIGGFAVILHLDLRGAKRDTLKARKREGDRRFRKYLVDLGGRGISDLAMAGDDLLILTGGPTAAEVPAWLYRWPDVISAGESALVRGDMLSPVTALHFFPSADAPVAMAVLEGERVLMLHDRPRPSRLDRRTGVYIADVVKL